MRLLAALLCAAAYGQTVEGTVVDAVTGAPIAGVTVRIESQGKPSRSAATDTAGAFQVDGLADGTYSAAFNKSGFGSPSRQPFSVRAGSDAARLQVRMTPYGKVSGRVLDAGGNPVPGAGVELMSATFNGEMGTAGQDGTFQFQVAAGTYTLSARPPRGLKPPPSPAGEKRGWIHTWYPGAIDASAAAKIVVGPGNEVWGQDVKLTAVPVYGVRGTVRDWQGNACPEQTVRATPTDELQPVDVETTSAQDGAFEFADLHEGSWRISAEFRSGTVLLRASLPVGVAGRSIERLDLRLSAPFSVQVHTTVETPNPKMEQPFVGVMLAPEGGGGDLAHWHAEGGGKLRLDPLYPGAYRVNPIQPDGPYYLASVTMGGRDILGQYVELNSAGLPIEVVYKSDGGTVRGSIENCGGAAIVLAPRERALRQQELLVTGRCTSDGRFEISHLRPAEYYAFAFEKFDQMAFEFLARLDDQTLINSAERITVRTNEATRVDLKVQ